ncbi:DUF4180 domain-containing protein [Kineosporia rhizophila]|uniref:DUF4180 domain-containing protein n=1 Tax=Kineosporia rhizophila TaxID=84633 RepID=UPI001E5709FC|nr:DUF4180 domain-containing protein [Kineosporia rhizophila]MCE0539544.1 DUF4180 domain-containing protein [Kineosporia rhizophila]
MTSGEPVAGRPSAPGADVVETIGDVQVLVCDPHGPVVAGEADALDLVGTAAWQGVGLVILPLSRLGPDFLRLRTGLAGAITQKFANYRVRLAVVGDISAHTATGTALRDFVAESNRGQQLWFLDDVAAVRRRLTGR